MQNQGDPGVSFTKIDRFRISFELNFKYGTIYRPYLIKFDMDVCELTQKDSDLNNDKVLKIFFKILEKEFPAFLKGCPYEVY